MVGFVSIKFIAVRTSIYVPAKIKLLILSCVNLAVHYAENAVA